MIFRFVSILIAAAGLLAAADVTGRWSGVVKMTLDGNDLELPHEVNLKQSGSAITGTAGPGADQQWAIATAQLQGTELTFVVKVPDGPTFEYRLTLATAEMAGDYRMTADGQVSSAKIQLRKK